MRPHSLVLAAALLLNMPLQSGCATHTALLHRANLEGIALAVKLNAANQALVRERFGDLTDFAGKTFASASFYGAGDGLALRFAWEIPGLVLKNQRYYAGKLSSTYFLQYNPDTHAIDMYGDDGAYLRSGIIQSNGAFLMELPTREVLAYQKDSGSLSFDAGKVGRSLFKPVNDLELNQVLDTQSAQFINMKRAEEAASREFWNNVASAVAVGAQAYAQASAETTAQHARTAEFQQRLSDTATAAVQRLSQEKQANVRASELAKIPPREYNGNQAAVVLSAAGAKGVRSIKETAGPLQRQQNTNDSQRIAERSQAAEEARRKQQLEQAEADRRTELAARQADERQREEAAKRQAELDAKQRMEQEINEELNSLRSKIQMAVKSCGKDDVRIGGVMPKGKHLIDNPKVHYTVYCPGNISARGTHSYFVGDGNSCVGSDMFQIKIPCKAEEARVVVDQVTRN